MAAAPMRLTLKTSAQTLRVAAAAAMIFVCRNAAAGPARDPVVYGSLATIYCYGFLAYSENNGALVHNLDALFFETIGRLSLARREDVPRSPVRRRGAAPLKILLVRRIMHQLHSEALMSVIRVSNRRRECLAMLPSVLQDGEFRDKASLALAATLLGLDWLSDAIVHTINLSRESPCLYLLAKKCRLSPSEGLAGRIRSQAATGRPDVVCDIRRLVLDAKHAGDMHALSDMQHYWKIINDSNIGFFMDSELVFALERLYFYACAPLSRHAWVEEDVAFVVRGGHEALMHSVPIERLVQCILAILERGGDGLNLISAVDFALSRMTVLGIDKQVLHEYAGDQLLRLIAAVKSSDLSDDLAALLGEHPEYVHDKRVWTWILKKERWNVLDLLAQSCEGAHDTEVELDEETTLLLLQCNRRDTLQRLGRGALILNVGAWAITRHLPDILHNALCGVVHIVGPDARIIEMICRNAGWPLVERLREKVAERGEFDRFVTSISGVIRRRYMAYVCGQGSVEMLVSLMENGVRPGVLDANRACESGNVAVTRHLLAAGIAPDEDGVFYALRAGNAEMVELLAGSGVLPEVCGDGAP